MDFFKSDGIWLKGNLHCHSTISDGGLSPNELTLKYKEARYDFLAFTEHNIKHEGVENIEANGLVLLPGAEMPFIMDNGQKGEILAINLKEHIDTGDGIGPQEVINAVRDQGALAIVAHPYWSELDTSDLEEFDGYCGIEIFNYSCHTSQGRGYSTIYWDTLLRKGRNIYGFAADDCHNHSFNSKLSNYFRRLLPNDLCGAWIMVKAKERTIDGIMQAITKGHFYSSNGPEIKDIKVNGNKLVIQTSEVQAIVVSAHGYIHGAQRGQSYTAPGGETLNHIEHELKNPRSLRVECCDVNGNRAWSNCLFFPGWQPIVG